MKFLFCFLILGLSVNSFAKSGPASPKGECSFVSRIYFQGGSTSSEFKNSKIRLNSCIDEAKGRMLSSASTILAMKNAMIKFKVDKKNILYFELRLSSDGQSVEVLDSTADAYNYYMGNAYFMMNGPIKN